MCVWVYHVAFGTRWPVHSGNALRRGDKKTTCHINYRKWVIGGGKTITVTVRTGTPGGPGGPRGPSKPLGPYRTTEEKEK